MKIQIITLLAICLLETSCKKNEVSVVDDNEQITSVVLKFKEQGSSTTLNFTLTDPDGDGPKPISKLDKISLKANTLYNFSIEIYDETKNPVEDIGANILAEKDEHLFVYTPTPSSLLTFTISDKDSKNLPVGLIALVKTSSVGTGTLKVQLRHQPGVKDGTPTPGSDDINQDFLVEVK